MRAALTYAPRPGPLGRARPWIAALYLAPLAVISFSFANPVVLVAAGVAALLVAVASDALRASLAPLRFGAYLAVTVIVVNVIVSQRGDTVLLRGWDLPVVGQIDVSAEALAEGGVLALRILVALIVFAVWSACVDPDRVLRGVRPLAARSALAATVVTRLVPLAAADSVRLGEAARLRGPDAAPVGRATLARRLIAGSLDRAVDVAATLELRGYGLPVRAATVRHARRPGELALALAGTAMAGVALAAGLTGVGAFSAYPVVSVDLDPAMLAFAAAIPLLAIAPFLTPPELRRLRDSRARARRLEIDDTKGRSPHV